MLIPTLLEKLQSREAITIQGNPGLRLNPIHVSDAVRVIERSLVHAPQGAFNVCGDETVSLTELVAVMEKATGIAAQIEYAASTSTQDLVADNGKMKAMLGISPSTMLLEGIRGML
jgi:nucleoside-diphosphate-sugar epimerase